MVEELDPCQRAQISREVKSITGKPVRAVTPKYVYIGESRPPSRSNLTDEEISFLLGMTYQIEELRNPDLLFPLIAQKKHDLELKPRSTGRIRPSRKPSIGEVWFEVADDLVRQVCNQNGIKDFSRSRVYNNIRLSLETMLGQLNIGYKGSIPDDRFISEPELDRRPISLPYNAGIGCLCSGKGLARLWHQAAIDVFDRVENAD